MLMKSKERIGIVGLIFLLALVAITATASADTHDISGQTASFPGHVIQKSETLNYYPQAKGTTYFTMKCVMPYCGVNQKQAVVYFYWSSNASPNWTHWATKDYYNSLSVKLTSGSPDVRYKIIIKNTSTLLPVKANIVFKK